jgi:adenylate cyclase
MQKSDPDRDAGIAALRDWILWQGIEGQNFEKLIEGMSLRLRDLGIGLIRVHTTFRALHPKYGAVAHRWHSDRGTESETFGNTITPNPEWISSPLYRMIVENLDEFRERLDEKAPVERYPILAEMRARGGTEYFAARVLYVDPSTLGEIDPLRPPEGMIISFVCDTPGGFSARDLDDLRAILPALAITLKAESSRKMTQDLLATYLGPDASGRVMSGEIDRGSSEKISAVILLFDLSGFTRLSETLEGRAIIDLLNGYYSVVVDKIERNGGNVLKFMGDGLLAVFSQADEHAAGRVAIDTVRAIRAEMQEINATREAEGQPTTRCTMALHAGDVLYGNIGGYSRLDFTVIGPAVNTTARLSGMCGHVDQPIVISARVARPHLSTEVDLVSLGQYRVRGVSERIELFTLD